MYVWENVLRNPFKRYASTNRQNREFLTEAHSCRVMHMRTHTHVYTYIVKDTYICGYTSAYMYILCVDIDIRCVFTYAYIYIYEHTYSDPGGGEAEGVRALAGEAAVGWPASGGALRDQPSWFPQLHTTSILPLKVHTSLSCLGLTKATLGGT